MSSRISRIVLFIVALVVGFALGYIVRGSDKIEQNSSEQDLANTQTVSPLSVDLRLKLNSVLREHPAIAVPYLAAQVANIPDAQEFRTPIDVNNAATADLINEVYPGKRAEFLAIWEKHINYYDDYVKAARGKDTGGQQQARQNLNNFANELSTFLVTNNPRLNQERLKNDIAVHGDHVTSLIDSMAAGNYTTAFATAHEAYDHMGTIADMLYRAIVEQMPDKYSLTQ